MKKTILTLILLAGAALLPQRADALPAQAAALPDLCGAAIARTEQARGIPQNFLRAVGLAESGRWDAGARQGVPWPWTVNAEGEGNYYPTKAAAIAAVRRLQARGVKSIDVGCMQVNLYWHGDAFSSLGEAFEPEANVAYAADFLSRLKEERRSWQNAVGYYHSATPEFNQRYRAKVLRLWQGVRDQDFAGLEEEVRFSETARSAARRQLPTMMPAWAKSGGAAETAGAVPGSARIAAGARQQVAQREAPSAGGLAAYRKRAVPTPQSFQAVPESLVTR
ncbi:MAG: murein transglycosylase [Oceanibaculum sp.]